MSGTQNKLLLVLERSIAAIGEAKVIVIDARRLNTDHPAKGWYHQLGVPLPMTITFASPIAAIDLSRTKSSLF